MALWVREEDRQIVEIARSERGWTKIESGWSEVTVSRERREVLLPVLFPFSVRDR